MPVATMGGIIIPDDRTPKQRPRAYCTNPMCAVNGEEFTFEVDHSRFACPKCGADHAPMVGMLVLTHYVVFDMKGQIEGLWGRRYRLACDSQRAYLATVSNLEAASGSLAAVNCPGCLRAAKKLAKTNLVHRLIPQGDDK